MEYYILIKLKRKVTIIIFEIVNDNIKIKNPLKGNKLKYGNEYIFIIKNSILYEPILYNSSKGYPKYIFSKDHKDKNIRNVVRQLDKKIKDYEEDNINPSVNQTMNINNIIQTINKLDGYKPVNVYVNNNNRVTYIKCENNMILPVNPCGLDIESSIKPIFALNEENLLHYNYYYNNIQKSPILNKIYDIEALCVKEGKIIQVIVNKSYIPVKPMTRLKNKEYTHKRIFNDKNLLEVDNILSDNAISKPNTNIDSINIEYDRD